MERVEKWSMKDWLYLWGICGAVVVIFGSLLFLSSQKPLADNHRDNIVIELHTTSGERIKLSCPEYEGYPLGAHGRECYLVKEK